ncbi:unnamed protein product, partial [Ixodes persulcatus]
MRPGATVLEKTSPKSLNAGNISFRCHEEGHMAKQCPRLKGKEGPRKPENGSNFKVQAVTVADEEPLEKGNILTAKVEMRNSSSNISRSQLQPVQLVCGDIQIEAVLDTGSEITVMRESLVPEALRDPSGTVKLMSAFGETIQAKLATLPIEASDIGTVKEPQRIELVCALTNQLAKGVDCLLSKE